MNATSLVGLEGQGTEQDQDAESSDRSRLPQFRMMSESVSSHEQPVSETRRKKKPKKEEHAKKHELDYANVNGLARAIQCVKRGGAYVEALM